MKVPEGFEKHCSENVVLLLLRALHGSKQNAHLFWKQLLMAFKDVGHQRCKADPCLCCLWTSLGLVLWMSWVNNCLVAGNKEAVDKAKEQMER